jgi:hypothetical protein
MEKWIGLRANLGEMAKREVAIFCPKLHHDVLNEAH